MPETHNLQDEEDYLEILAEEDPYGPEFVPIDEEDYEYTTV